MELGHDANLYLVQGGDPNASVLHDDDDRLDVTVTSALVEFPTAELKFVLGHELQDDALYSGHSDFSEQHLSNPKVKSR